MWFNENDLIKFSIIERSYIRGYVLPHASTKYTGHIISHTLRFKPTRKFKNVCILYYPVSEIPNVDDQYHEYYVVQKSFDYIYKKFWKVKEPITYIPYNVKTQTTSINYKDTLIIVSADFSHFKPLKDAIDLENCAAHSLMHRNFRPKCTNVIDSKKQFEVLYNTIPKSWMLQWVGRTRSPGEKGVGYLSFLIKDINNIPKPDGVFVTAYDISMRSRECLGLWFSPLEAFSNDKLNKHVNNVIEKAHTTSRLTNGKYLPTKLYGYTISYLYEDKINKKTKNKKTKKNKKTNNRTKKNKNNRTNPKFIRGWHGIKYNSFYLSDVFLEHTFNNGNWIKFDNDNNKEINEWSNGNTFDMTETLDKLVDKSGIKSSLVNNYKLYYSHAVHHKIIE